jgi:hypothetical protein
MALNAHSTNIVRLPTARSRKVKQAPGLEMIRLAAELPQHPAEWEDHGGRKAWQEGRFDQSPEMLIIAAIFRLMPEVAQKEVRRQIATIADCNLSLHAASALSVVEAVR